MEAYRHLSSYADPAGDLYEAEDLILRGIKPEFADFYLQLTRTSTLAKLNGSLLVETKVSDISLNGYPLTLLHKKISPVSYCYEWHATMLRDAALLTLDLCEELAEQNLILKDAYPWNVLFQQGVQPIHVDFTSIVPVDSNLMWVAYDQFCRFFLYPLVLYSFWPSKPIRMLLTDYIEGISDTALIKMLPKHAAWKLHWLFPRVYLPRLIVNILSKFVDLKELNKTSAKLKPNREARLSFFRALRRDVESIPLKRNKSRWSRYYEDYFSSIESFFESQCQDNKQVTVRRILDEIRPATVTDIGCNVGGYSILAAYNGARVVSFDIDDDSIELLYQLAKERQLNIHPLILDVLNPSPGLGWRGLQFVPAITRFRSEMAFALALVHHLAITQRQTFERIVAALSDFTDKWLLTEFIPLTDPRVVEITATTQRDLSWYTLNRFLEVLLKVFRSVQTFPSHPEGRTLILCSK